jgi:large subunit ribosomal protein L3
MTQVFDGQRNRVLVTVVEAVRCFVAQLKEQKKDSYGAVQLAYGRCKEINLSDPVRGHLKKAGLWTCDGFREFRVSDLCAYKVGDAIDFSIFNVGE